MNLQEQISRIKSMMGLLTELTNPYRVNWLAPDNNYMIQELDELLGNVGRFRNEEFFNQNNFDVVYNIMPKTFKKAAEFVKGSEIENDEEIKNLLISKNLDELIGMDSWTKLKGEFMSDRDCVQEGINFFSKGELKVWKGYDDNQKYVDNIDNTEYMGKLETFLNPVKGMASRRLSQHLRNQSGKEEDERTSNALTAYADNIDRFKEMARKNGEMSLPAPFVVKYYDKKYGKDYVLIGGHKRSAIALTLNVEPIKVWLIDLTK